MATPTQHAASPIQQRRSWMGDLLGLPGRLLGLLLVSLLLSILLEYAGMLLLWPEQGWQHSHAMLEAELGWLGEHFRQSLLHSDPARLARHGIDVLQQLLFQDSGLLDYARTARARHDTDTLAGVLAQLYRLAEDHLLAALFTSLTFAVRLGILLLATPLMALAVLTGLVDGLTRRDLRKFGAGRESSFVYHRAKGLIQPLLIAPWLTYLTLPVSLHPLWILLPCALLQGLAVAVTVATFKKYL